MIHGEACIIGYVHGNKDGLITPDEYKGFKACQSIDDLKLKLQNTIYAKTLLEESSSKPRLFRAALYRAMDLQMNTTLLFATATSKALISFYKELYQINNFIYLWACKQENPALFEPCHDAGEEYSAQGKNSLVDLFDINPIGMYDGLDFIRVTQGPEDTWRFCVENTPLKKYIEGFTYELLLEDIQYVTNILQKRYLDMLYAFSVENGLFLAELVKFEGDKRIIEIAQSTMGTTYTSLDRQALFPSCTTFTDAQCQLLSACKSPDGLKGVLSTHSTYRNLVGNDHGLEEALRREEIVICRKSFLYYDDPSVVYTQLKLQEVEVSNLIFLYECISQGRQDDIDHIVGGSA